LELRVGLLERETVMRDGIAFLDLVPSFLGHVWIGVVARWQM